MSTQADVRLLFQDRYNDSYTCQMLRSYCQFLGSYGRFISHIVINTAANLRVAKFQILRTINQTTPKYLTFRALKVRPDWYILAIRQPINIDNLMLKPQFNIAGGYIYTNYICCNPMITSFPPPKFPSTLYLENKKMAIFENFNITHINWQYIPENEPILIRAYGVTIFSLPDVGHRQAAQIISGGTPKYYLGNNFRTGRICDMEIIIGSRRHNISPAPFTAKL